MSRDETPISSEVGRWLDQMQALGQLTHERYNAGVASFGGRKVAMASAGHSDRKAFVKLAQDVTTVRHAISRPVALEVKKPGECVAIPDRYTDLRKKENKKKYRQYIWLSRQREVGSYCCVVHSVAEAKSHIYRASRGEVSPGPEQWAEKG